MLGGIVGGIIGAEIDGGYDRSTGAVIGAAVGAIAGAAATDDDDHYNDSGRHAYERTTYSPPGERRTCMRYEPVRGGYECVKWSIEYDYD